MNNKALYKFSYGLFVLTAEDKKNGRANGCIINTAIQLTSDPLKISIAVNKANYTHDLIMENKKFNISMISEDATFDLFKRFGFQSGKTENKFSGFSGYKNAVNDIPYITDGCNAYVSAWVTDTVDLGTHTLFIATVTDMEVLSDTPSATYTYYQSHIKEDLKPAGKTADGKTVWRCVICGYEYIGDVLPDYFICPICKHPASDFEKVN